MAPRDREQEMALLRAAEEQRQEDLAEEFEDEEDQEDEEGGWCSFFRRIFVSRKPRQLTVEEKNVFLRKVYAVLFAQMALTSFVGIATDLNPPVAAWFAKREGKSIFSAAASLLLGLQMLQRLRGKKASHSSFQNFAQLACFTGAQAVGFAGVCALTEKEGATNKIAILCAVFTTCVMLVQSLFGIQTSKPHNSLAGYTTDAVTCAIAAAFTKFSPITPLGEFGWRHVVGAAGSAFAIGSYSIVAGNRIITIGDVNPRAKKGSQIPFGATMLYSEFVTMAAQATSTGGLSVVKEGAVQMFRYMRGAGEE